MHKTVNTILIFFTLYGINTTVSANSESKIPPSLAAATTAYEKQGADAFISTLYGIPVTSSGNSELSNGISVLQKVEILYGNYIGVELIKDIQLSKSTRTVFFIMKYQRGPLYGVLSTYRQEDKSDIVMEFKVNIEKYKILPTKLLF